MKVEHEQYGERLAVLETGMEYIKGKVDHIDVRIDSFLSELKNNYTEKHEVRDLKARIEVLEKEVSNSRIFVAKVTGGILALVTLLQVVFQFLI